MMLVRKLIRADGSERDLGGPISMSAVHELLNAQGLDTVNLRHWGTPLHVMLVDDNGHAKGLPVNRAASQLYHLNCRPDSDPPPIVGDVVIVPDVDYA